jgi:hypothetical protein
MKKQMFRGSQHQAQMITTQRTNRVTFFFALIVSGRSFCCNWDCCWLDGASESLDVAFALGDLNFGKILKNLIKKDKTLKFWEINEKIGGKKQIKNLRGKRIARRPRQRPASVHAQLWHVPETPKHEVVEDTGDAQRHHIAEDVE